MPDQNLRRGLGFKETFSLVIGTVIGTGVFLKASIMTQQTGAGIWVLAAWGAAGIISLIGALCYSELGSKFPQAGGEYVFLREAFGPLPAFLNGWTLFWINCPGSIAGYSVGLITVLGGAVPIDASMRKVWSVAIIAGLTAVNCLTVKASGAMQTYLTAAKLTLILGLTALIYFYMPSTSGTPIFSDHAAWPGWRLFGAAMMGALWAYDGWNGMPMIAGEVKDPQRNIPRCLIIGMLSITFIYLLVNVVFFLALPLSEIATANSPAYLTALPVASKALVASVGMGALKWVSIVMAFSALVSLNGSILSGARVPFAMSRDGLFWRALGRLNPNSHVPTTALIAQGCIASMLACSGSFDQLTDYVMFAAWIFYTLSGLALFKLRKRSKPGDFSVPGFPVLPIIFIMTSVWLVTNTLMNSPRESMIGLGFILAGVPFYFYFSRRKKALAAKL